MKTPSIESTLNLVARFYDGCKYGCEGTEGYRKSTDLFKLARCALQLSRNGLIDPARTVLADLGCADGRVNVLMGYFCRLSIGIELDPEILTEYQLRADHLALLLQGSGLCPLPENIRLYSGSSLEKSTWQCIQAGTGVGFSGVNLFYTYITLHDLFGEKIAREAAPGSLYMVYGFSRVLPRYDGMELVDGDVAGQGIVALYRKPQA